MLSKFLKLGDWVNPILIKEVRQKTRSHFYHYVTIGILFLSYFILGTGVLSNLATGKQAMGGEGPIKFFVIFLTIGSLALPFSVVRAMRQEKDGQTIELLSLSGLSPRKILNGKLQGIFLDLFLFFSLTSPGILFCFLLGGIGIDILLDFILVIFFGSLLLSITAMAGSAVEEKYLSIGLTLIVPLFSGIGFTLIQFVERISTSRSPELFSIAQKEPKVFLGMLMVYGTVINLLYQFILSQLADPNDENTSQIKKGFVYFLMSIWLLGVQKGTNGLFSTYFFTLSLTPIIGLFFVTEGVLLTQKQLFLYPTTYWGRVYAFIFFPGKIRGYTFLFFLIALHLVPIVLVHQWVGIYSGLEIIDDSLYRSPFFSYSFYLILGMGMCRFLPKKFQNRPYRVLAILILALLGIISACLVFYGLKGPGEPDSFFMLLIPWRPNHISHPENIILLLIFYFFPIFAVTNDFGKTVLEKGDPNGE